jgi:photosystem II stability/assembly factor-like uncharacterized protein
MDDRRISERFRNALDSDPHPGAFERLQRSLDTRAAMPKTRPKIWPATLAGLVAVAVVVALMVPRLLNHSAVPAASGPVVPTRSTFGFTYVETSSAWWVLEHRHTADTILFRSTDQGRHWEAVLSEREEIGFPVPSGSRLTSTDVVLATPGKLLRSADGRHWTEEPLPAGSSTVSFLPDLRQGWILGPPEGFPGAQSTQLSVLHTVDGGRTWSQLPAADAAHSLYVKAGCISPVFFDSRAGFCPNQLLGPVVLIATVRTAWWTTADGGRNWQPSPALATNELLVGMVLNGSRGVAVTATGSLFTGSSVPRRLHVYRTQDSGGHWSNSGLVLEAQYIQLITTDRWVVWTTPNDVIRVTTDGGRSFTTQTLPVPPPAATPSPGVSTVPVGPAGVPGVELKPPGSYGGAFVISLLRFSSSQVGIVDESDALFVPLSHHALLRTTDGGLHWDQVPLPEPPSLSWGALPTP